MKITYEDLECFLDECKVLYELSEENVKKILSEFVYRNRIDLYTLKENSKVTDPAITRFFKKVYATSYIESK